MCMHQHTAHPYITPRTVYKLFVSVWGCFCHFLFVTNLCKFGVLFHVDVSHQNLCHAFLSNDSIFFSFAVSIVGSYLVASHARWRWKQAKKKKRFVWTTEGCHHFWGRLNFHWKIFSSFFQLSFFFTLVLQRIFFFACLFILCRRHTYRNIKYALKPIDIDGSTRNAIPARTHASKRAATTSYRIFNGVVYYMRKLFPIDYRYIDEWIYKRIIL